MQLTTRHTRIDGDEYWSDAKVIVDNFDNVARGIASEHADIKNLKGLKRAFYKAWVHHKIVNAKAMFMTASLIRASMGSKDTAKNVLEALSGLKRNKLG